LNYPDYVKGIDKLSENNKFMFLLKCYAELCNESLNEAGGKKIKGGEGKG
jgi:hypothetical protein